MVAQPDIFDVVYEELNAPKPVTVTAPVKWDEEDSLESIKKNLDGLVQRVQVRKKARSRMTEYLSKIVRAELEKIKPQEVIERQVEQIVKHETTVKHEQVPVHLEPKIVEAPPQIIRETRVEVQVPEKNSYVEKSVVDKLNKTILELKKEIEEVRRQAESPMFIPSGPGGPGVIGVPPPEGNDGKVLTVQSGKHSWVTPTSVEVPALDGITAPSASVNFNGQQATNFRVENLTSDPAEPAVGQVWLRTDL